MTSRRLSQKLSKSLKATFGKYADFMIEHPDMPLADIYDKLYNPYMTPMEFLYMVAEAVGKAKAGERALIAQIDYQSGKATYIIFVDDRSVDSFALSFMDTLRRIDEELIE